MKLWSCAFQHLHTVGVARRLLANEEPPSPVARRSLKHNGSRRGCVGVFRPSWFINKTGPWISANATITTQGRVWKRRLFLLVTCYRRYLLVLTSGGTYHVIIMLLCYILCGKDIKSPFGVWGKPISVLYVTLVCRSDNKVHFHINVRLWCREVLHKDPALSNLHHQARAFVDWSSNHIWYILIYAAQWCLIFLCLLCGKKTCLNAWKYYQLAYQGFSQLSIEEVQRPL